MEWFKHDSDASTDGKLSVLRMQHGSIAVDAYWYVLEQIYKYERAFSVSYADTENDCEAYTDEMRVLCGCMQAECEDMRELVRAMCNLGLLRDDGDEYAFLVHSPRAEAALEAASEKSRNASQAAKTRWSKSRGNAKPCKRSADAPRLKTKDSKTEDLDNCAAKPRFSPPTVDEVRSYAESKGYAIDAERFVNFYESKGWMVGKNKMTKWKAAVANWAKSNDTKGTGNDAELSEYAGAF